MKRSQRRASVAEGLEEFVGRSPMSDGVLIRRVDYSEGVIHESLLPPVCEARLPEIRAVLRFVAEAAYDAGYDDAKRGGVPKSWTIPAGEVADLDPIEDDGRMDGR